MRPSLAIIGFVFATPLAAQTSPATTLCPLLDASDVTPLLHGTHPPTSYAGPLGCYWSALGTNWVLLYDYVKPDPKKPASAQFDEMRRQNGSAAHDEPGLGDRAYSLDATYVVLIRGHILFFQVNTDDDRGMEDKQVIARYRDAGRPIVTKLVARIKG
jgi:hypothetical protein